MSAELVELTTRFKAATDKVEATAAAAEQKLTGVGLRLDDMEQKLARQPSGHPSPSEVKSDARAAYRKFIDSDAMKALKANQSGGTGKIPLDISLKAVTSLQGSPEAVPVGVDVRPERLAPVVPVQRPLSLLELLPSQPATSNAVEAPVFSNNSLSGSGYQEGEGAEKSEGTFAIDWESFPIATIAQHVTVSRQLLDDEPMLMATIDRLMRYDLRKKIDSELLNGDGLAKHIKGLLAYGVPFGFTAGFKPADRIGEAAAAFEDQGFSPGAAVLRATEMFKIESERDTAGSYVAGGWARPANSNLWGTRVAKSGAMPVNTALLLDLGWITVLDREAPSVQISSEHKSNFTENKITILCEARIGLYVANPLAIIEIALT